jgi:hypothetical protein
MEFLDFPTRLLLVFTIFDTIYPGAGILPKAFERLFAAGLSESQRVIFVRQQLPAEVYARS